MPARNASPKAKVAASKKKHGAGWSKSAQYDDITLPSGETCRVRKSMGVSGLIKMGVLDSLDSLTGKVLGETLPKAQGRPKVKAEDILADPKKYEDMMETVDKIVAYVVVEPVVLVSHRPVLEESGEPRLSQENKPVTEEIPEEDRDEEAVYSDYIDEMDRMAIMQYALGGNAEFDRFRRESAAALDGVPDGEADEDAAV
jgi:hypothetical protein